MAAAESINGSDDVKTSKLRWKKFEMAFVTITMYLGGRGGGDQVISMLLAFYLNNPSSNPA